MLKTFSVTDIGRKRKTNQDYVYTSEQPVGSLPNLFLVADGMGGHNAGDYASRVAVEGMGTTVVAAACEGNRLYVANVGDSRLYVINRFGIRQITRDHSWVEEMVRLGEIEKEEARNHPDKNIITRAVGTDDMVKTDFFAVQLEEGDEVLMCTDGLTNMLEDEEIRMILDGARDIVEKAQQLVRAANDNGGRDNISVILIET